MSVVFEISHSEIYEYSSIDTIQNWDSIRQLNLIIALEEEFQISIPDEEIGNMVNYKIIYHVILEALENKIP
ncbi:acyl carrier protein [Algoriphagus sp. 4150]|uniref:acyl carrier protein n=1 Tax=Algoriphagus sp. 4150 TaxID=2817756 RepID=UPI002866A7A1|nr:hypothetical protein [Algoriphagus sp. 4150]MDR7132689.1 acyl carrier protein [Algoriphagus sp. 4150]